LKLEESTDLLVNVGVETKRRVTQETKKEEKRKKKGRKKLEKDDGLNAIFLDIVSTAIEVQLDSRHIVNPDPGH